MLIQQIELLILAKEVDIHVCSDHANNKFTCISTTLWLVYHQQYVCNAYKDDSGFKKAVEIHDSYNNDNVLPSKTMYYES